MVTIFSRHSMDPSQNIWLPINYGLKVFKLIFMVTIFLAHDSTLFGYQLNH